MKRFMNTAGKVFFCGALVVILAGMGDGAKRGNVGLEPSYAPLEEGEVSLTATVYDETTVTEIQDVSFFGHPSIGGIRKETDDSTNKLELGKIKELDIVKNSFESKRFQDREFCLVKVVTANGMLIEDLLVPKHVIICGIEKATQMERAWFLSKIDKVVFEKPLHEVEKPEVVIERAFKKEQDTWEKPEPKKQEKVGSTKDGEVKKAEPIKEQSEKKAEPEPKKSGFYAILHRLLNDVLDLIKEAFKVIAGWLK